MTLKEYLDSSKDNLTRAFTFFGFDYHDSLIKMQENGHTIPTLVTDAYNLAINGTLKGLFITAYAFYSGLKFMPQISINIEITHSTYAES